MSVSVMSDSVISMSVISNSVIEISVISNSLHPGEAYPKIVEQHSAAD